MRAENRGKKKVNPRLLGDKTMKVLHCLHKHKLARASEIAKAIGSDTYHVLAYLYYLEKKGLVERTWRAWSITKLGEKALKEYLDYLEKLKIVKEALEVENFENPRAELKPEGNASHQGGTQNGNQGNPQGVTP